MARKTGRKAPKRNKGKKRSRWQEVGQPAVLLGVIVAVTLAFYAVVYDPLDPVGTVGGVVSAVSQPQAGPDITAPVVLTVSLDSGESVRVSASSLDQFEVGGKVTLQHLQSRLLRRPEYRYIDYSPPAP